MLKESDELTARQQPVCRSRLQLMKKIVHVSNGRRYLPFWLRTRHKRKRGFAFSVASASDVVHKQTGDANVPATEKFRASESRYGAELRPARLTVSRRLSGSNGRTHHLGSVVPLVLAPGYRTEALDADPKAVGYGLRVGIYQPAYYVRPSRPLVLWPAWRLLVAHSPGSIPAGRPSGRSHLYRPQLRCRKPCPWADRW